MFVGFVDCLGLPLDFLSKLYAMPATVGSLMLMGRTFRPEMEPASLGQAFTSEEPLDARGIGSLVCVWSTQAARSSLDALLVINVAGTPLVSDWVALCQALVNIEAVWHLGNGHHASVVLVLACTFEADDLVVQGHLLALCIAGLLPVCPARPHPAVSAVACDRVICDRAVARESWNGEAVWPRLLVDGKVFQRIITPALVFLDRIDACISNDYVCFSMHRT
jgi:hypothetical protein